MGTYEDTVRAVKHIKRAGVVALIASAVFASSASANLTPIKELQLTGPSKDIEIFLDGFFARFSELSEKRRSGTSPRAMVPLLRHAKSTYERSPVASRAEDPIDSAKGLVAKLWIHGPKTWTITELDWQKDSAFAKVWFQSVADNRPDPIPFGFKFLKAGQNWKIAGYLDLRGIDTESINWQSLIVTGNENSPEMVFTNYMDQIEQYYSPKKAKESMQLAPQVQQKLAPMWLPTEDASKSLGRSMMTFSQLQPRNWQFVSSDYVESDSELVIQATAGNPVMRRNMGMATMMGSGMKFTLERVGDEWRLKSYGRSSR